MTFLYKYVSLNNTYHYIYHNIYNNKYTISIPVDKEQKKNCIFAMINMFYEKYNNICVV